MKKQYIKPIITFDSLAVSATISSGCAYISGDFAEYACPIEDPEAGWTIFNDSAVCMMMPGPGDTICYDIPFAASNVFES